MSLELKHLVGYLPYNLKSVLSASNFGIEKLEGDVTLTNVSGIVDGTSSAKPLLRPIEELKNEIEHNGERFIPILELFKISITGFVEEYKINSSWDEIVGFACGIRVVDSVEEVKILSYSEKHGFATQKTAIVDVIKDRTTELTLLQDKLWEKLYEWHFDIHGLIKKGIAVRKE